MSDQSNVNRDQPSTGSSVVRQCAACGAPVPPTRRKYCDVHGPEASKLRKREVRRDEARTYRLAHGGGLNPPSPHLKGWSSREAYNEHYRAAMKASRARRKAARIAAPAVEHAA